MHLLQRFSIAILWLILHTSRTSFGTPVKKPEDLSSPSCIYAHFARACHRNSNETSKRSWGDIELEEPDGNESLKNREVLRVVVVSSEETILAWNAS